MTANRRRPVGHHQAPPATSRRAERRLAGIGGGRAPVCLGGCAVVVNRIAEATYLEVARPVLLGGSDHLSAAEAFEAGRTRSAWFGFTLLLVLALAAVAILSLRRRAWRRRTAWWLLA